MEINYPQDLEPIVCTECNDEMLEGYYNEDEVEYFCSPECLDHYYKEPISEKLSAMDDDDLEFSPLYWTEWEDYSEERERYRLVYLTLEQIKIATEDDKIGLYMAINTLMQEYCNDENRYTLKIVWVVGYYQFFDRYIAELIGEGTEPTRCHVAMRPYQTIREGVIKGKAYSDLAEARKVLKQMEQEDQNR